MTSTNRTAGTDTDKPSADVASLQKITEKQAAQIQQLQQQLDWFKRQLFGEKSEKRHSIDPDIQPSLLEGLVPEEEPVSLPDQTVAAHARTKK